MMKLLGVIGDPIHHSLSPLIHNYWLREAGITATYEAMRVPAGELGEALAELAQRDVVGLNITLPHKHDALRLSDTASEAARRVGAVNTLTRKDRKWAGNNTDIFGFQQALKRKQAGNQAERRVLVLGAGGSARAVVSALVDLGAFVTVANRTQDRAQALVDDLAPASGRALGLDGIEAVIRESDLVVNTLPLGHSGGRVDLPAGEDRLFFDISYGRAAAAQLRHAQERGWQTEDGLRMLVAQAAESFRLWFDLMPETETILQRCRDLVEATS